VLGESSAKSLRGTESEDVIFNGAKGRKPGGRASVELLFDNADNTLQGAYGSYAEIAVRREVVRGDGSQYFINGQKCLKRDVVDLFLGTGLGGRNQYAILEQGTISRLVDAKPEELRLWLEEAAGISRYKDRRRETETRIRQTRENLERLADLEGEIQQRLKVLTRQAADAEKYREQKQRERVLKAEVLLLRQRALEAQAAQQQAGIHQFEERLETARAALSAADNQRTQAETAQRAAAGALNAQQGEVYQSEAALARDEQALAHARELQTLHGREQQQIEAQLLEAGERQKRETRRRDEVLHALQEAQSQAESTAAAEQTLSDEASQAEEAFTTEQAQWESFNQRAQAPMLEAEGERARLQGLERASLQVEERQRRLEQER
ncbi:MAG: chromosome segregation protein SMC, partial [Ktedonobacterales bacterium]|nr:chromosome segregation protein SMC [Ktedonobacterales bacterium]